MTVKKIQLIQLKTKTLNAQSVNQTSKLFQHFHEQWGKAFGDNRTKIQVMDISCPCLSDDLFKSRSDWTTEEIVQEVKSHDGSRGSTAHRMNRLRAMCGYIWHFMLLNYWRELKRHQASVSLTLYHYLTLLQLQHFNFIFQICKATSLSKQMYEWSSKFETLTSHCWLYTVTYISALLNVHAILWRLKISNLDGRELYALDNLLWNKGKRWLSISMRLFWRQKKAGEMKLD